ncbi:lebercilin-like isoform X3 [Mya arenaria]|uniref:lebercilin-like isoform X3 n=1 Tax=Mya arenaria TaxID=6604 RepID=UPI0022E46416|nr:lebercilin-like isoform X3 [Mya arenaria]
MGDKNRGTSPYDDDYSDDFDDDASDVGNRRYKTRSPLTRTASGHEVKRPKDSRSSDSKLLNRSNRGRGRGRGGRMTGRSSQESHVDNITRRVLSARRLKINEIQNMNQEFQAQLRELKEENKLLKKTQHRTDKALQRFEDRESDLPQLIQRQNNEVRSLKDQIRKWREKFEKTDRYLRDAEDELEKAKIKLKKLKSLADEKELPERAELNKKLNNAELDMEAKDVKIKELERYIQNLEKNHRHEIGIERARNKDVHKQIAQLREENDKLNNSVKEKEKEIQIKNIYVNRAQQKPPHRLPNSYNGTPHGTPPPARRRRQSFSEADKMTPRDRAKKMEEKRREELKRQRELKMASKKPGEFLYVDEKNPRHNISGTNISGNNKSGNNKSGSNVTHADKIRREKELREMAEEDERLNTERREREERERQEAAERERRLNEEAQQDMEDRRMREERERMKRESLEREQREREKREREERERERREKREKEERDRRERERLEQERRAAEERRRFEDDVSIQAERKKKDDILAKLREIDEGGAGKKKEKENKAPLDDPFFVTQVKEDSIDSVSSKKSYTFTKPTENLHKGKPAHKDRAPNNGFTVGPGRKKRDDVNHLESGGYNPTFGSNQSGATSKGATKTFSLFDDDDSKSRSTAPPKPAQKSRLLDDLFGSSEKEGPKHNDIFSTSKPAQKSQARDSRSKFPWEEDGPSRNQTGAFKANRENSATLFGGGSALVNDEDLHKSQVRTNANASLPRRPKQTTTAFSSRPTVNAVDHFDDDIEEVIL